jgi:hypothetical protein
MISDLNIVTASQNEIVLKPGAAKISSTILVCDGISQFFKWLNPGWFNSFSDIDIGDFACKKELIKQQSIRRTILPAMIIMLASCSHTPVAKWDAAAASKTCFDAATKNKYDLTAPQIKHIKGICDCVGQKMTTTFKTEKEANEKKLDAAVIANECTEEWQKMEIQNSGK